MQLLFNKLACIHAYKPCVRISIETSSPKNRVDCSKPSLTRSVLVRESSSSSREAFNLRCKTLVACLASAVLREAVYIQKLSIL